MISPGTPPTRSKTSHRVLLVDDSTEFTEILKEHLLEKRDPSWTVHTASNYAEALSCLKTHPVDLVVLDIQMPVLDGLQLLSMLKRNRPALPVVVLSGMASTENRQSALQMGAALFLSKMDVASGFESIYPALEATVEAPAEGFKGIVRQVGLMEILQLECLGKKSSVLEIKGSDADGRIYISEGAIIHAEAGGILGEKALAKMYGLKGGEFRLVPFSQPPRRTITGHWETLLLEAAQYCDEQAEVIALTEVGGFIPQPQAPDATAEAKGENGRNIEEIVLSSTANVVLYEWNAPHADRRVKLLDWLLTKSAHVATLLPALGRPDRLEISENESRVVCVVHPERRVFIRVSLATPGV